MKRFIGFLKNCFLVLGSLIVVIVISEIGFGVLVNLGWVKTATETYNGEPYGFYFWSREGGHPRGFNNRFGYPNQDFSLEKKQELKRVAIIGDSFVEALQVGIPDKMGSVLKTLLAETEQRFDVVSFGRSGEYPAYYLERAKVMVSTLSSDIVFIMVFMGNDFRNASPEIENKSSGVTADRYIFYSVNPITKDVDIDLKSQQLVGSYRQWGGILKRLERSHAQNVNFSTEIMVHNFMLKNSYLYSEIPYRYKKLLRNLAEESKVVGNKVSQEKDISDKKICDAESIYVKSYDDCWVDSKMIMTHLIGEFKKLEENSGVKIYFMGIPANESYWGDDLINDIVTSDGNLVPKENYNEYLAKKYAVNDSDIDLLKPNVMMKDIMDQQGVRYLDLYDRFYNELTEKKKPVYCRWINGHLCENGHRIVAEEMQHIINNDMLESK
jgi:hypothetical protein